MELKTKSNKVEEVKEEVARDMWRLVSCKKVEAKKRLKVGPTWNLFEMNFCENNSSCVKQGGEEEK